jgi:two-component system, cell cycle sensor histidine kinase and response regulator CckA
MKDQIPPYDELKRRLASAEGALKALRDGQVDTITGEHGTMVVRLAEAEARADHVKRVLLAIRNVNQLIVRETDPKALMKKVCAELTKTRGYFNAWIALMDEAETCASVITSSGFNRGFDTMKSNLKRGVLPSCMQQTLAGDKLSVIKNPQTDCPDCPLSSEYAGRSGMSSRLSYGEKTYGILFVSVPEAYTYDKEEHDLFTEMANDLAFALNKIETDAQVHKLNQIITSIPQPISFVSQDYRYLAVNDVHTELFETAAQKIIGQTPAEFFGKQVFETEIRPRLDHVLKGNVLHFEIQVDFPGRGKRWMSMSYYPYRNENGDITGVISHGHDITERKQAEEALRKSEECFSLAMEASKDGIWDWDLTTGYIYCSPALTSMLGYDSTGVIEHVDQWQDLTHPEDRQIAYQANLDCVNNLTDSFVIEYRMKTRDGGWKWILGRGEAVFRDLSGKALRMIGTHQDITERKQADEALRKSEWYLRSTLDGLSAHIAVIDDRGEIILTNKAYRDFGVQNDIESRSVSEGANYLAVCDTALGGHSEEAKPFADGIRRVLSGMSPSFELEYPCHSPDEKRWFVGRVTPFTGEGPRRVVIAHENITERKQAEEALLESEQFLQILLESLPVPVFYKDVEGQYKGFNKAFETFFGTSRLELLGKSVFDINPPELAKIYHDKDIELYEKSSKQIYESQVKNACGELRNVFFHKATLTNVSGAISGLVGAIMDITAIKEAEQNLSSTLSLLDAALESTEDGILVINRTGKITKMNKKFLEMWQIPAELAILPEDKTLLQYAVKQLADPQAFLFKVRELYDAPADISFDEIEFFDGRVFERYSQPQWLDKQIVGRVWSFRDVTSRKRSELEREKLQAQLTHAQKMESIGRLAGGVAHDFNNMLGVILGYTELAMERVEADNPLHTNLEKIQGAAQRSAELTRQLLAFARKQTVSPKVIDLNDTIESMLKLMLRLIGENIDMVWRPGKEVWPVKIDPAQVDQILTNLCVNARDAIVDTGKVTIETGIASLEREYCAHHAGCVPGEYVLLAVSDTGCGMDENTQSQIFEPFFTTKEQGKGTGLGLASVYGAVKQNNGFINVYSEPGQGTTFKIYLPRHLAKTVPLPEKRPYQGERNYETILLVEDEPALLEMTTRMLERLGYTVLPAGNPGEAVRLVQEHSGRIDLLLTDVVMPEMNGRDLAKNLLSISPDIRLLFMSGYTANVIAQHGVLDGGVHFIQKPFSKKDLGEKLREALNKSLGRPW